MGTRYVSLVCRSMKSCGPHVSGVIVISWNKRRIQSQSMRLWFSFRKGRKLAPPSACKEDSSRPRGNASVIAFSRTLLHSLCDLRYYTGTDFVRNYLA